MSRIVQDMEIGEMAYANPTALQPTEKRFILLGFEEVFDSIADEGVACVANYLRIFRRSESYFTVSATGPDALLMVTPCDAEHFAGEPVFEHVSVTADPQYLVVEE